MRRGARIYNEQATHTRPRLIFYPHDNQTDLGVVDGYDPNADQQLGHLMSVTTMKAFGQASGNFTITFKKPTTYNKSFLRFWNDPEGIWVKIEWICDNQQIDGMLGRIDSIAESNTVSGAGAQSETYTIIGKDFGGIFEQTVQFLNLYDNVATMGLEGYYNRITPAIADGTPGGWVRAYTEAWLKSTGSNAQAWVMPGSYDPGGGQPLFNILQQQIGCDDELIDGRFDDPTANSPQSNGSSLWDLLQSHSNGILNELWCDYAPQFGDDPRSLRGLAPTITLRRKPFKTRHDRYRWDQLQSHTLKPVDISSRKPVKGGGANRYNYWMLQLQGKEGYDTQAILQDGGAGNGQPGSIPIWNVKSIERHGVRVWNQSTNFLPITSVESTQFEQAAANWLRRIHDWYSVGPYQISGQITTSRIRPEIRIGTKLFEERDEGTIEYYVEGVTNSWSFGSGGNSNFTLTRGEYLGENLLNYIYEELEAPQATTLQTGREVRIGNEGFSGDGLFGEDVEENFEFGSVTETEIRDTERREGDLSLLGTDTPSPSEQDSARAAQGLPEQTLTSPTPTLDDTSNNALSENALNTNEPISVPDDPFGGADFSDTDPIGGLDFDDGI